MIDLLNRLTAADPRERDTAAAELGDLLRAGTLDRPATERVVRHLVALAVGEPDHDVAEQALYSIAEAFDHHELPLPLVAPLTTRLPTMTPALLEHALYILAVTHDQSAKPILDRYTTHPDAQVRIHATDALQELPGRR